MGEACAEVWANLGLSCFYAGQYDLCFNCFERALGQADDALLPDIWYNIGQVSWTGDAGAVRSTVRSTTAFAAIGDGSTG
jgi:hypothetical protein